MDLQQAFKKAIKAYFDQDEDTEPDTLQAKTYNKKYFDEREKEYFGNKDKKKKKDED